MTYVIVYLILDALSGQPLKFGLESEVTYPDYVACDRAKSQIGLQVPKDGKVKVLACATEKQITTL